MLPHTLTPCLLHLVTPTPGRRENEAECALGEESPERVPAISDNTSVQSLSGS